MPANYKTTTEQQQGIDRLTDNLKTLRAAAGLSQLEMANAIGVSRATYTNYENKRVEMPWSTYLAIMCYFIHCEKTQKILTALNLTVPSWATTQKKKQNKGGANYESEFISV